MYFDRRLWQLTRGLRWRIALDRRGRARRRRGRHSALRPPGLADGAVFRGAAVQALALPAALVFAAVLVRAALEHARTMVAHRTAAQVQAILRGKLYDKVAALGPAWFAGERSGGVVLSVIDGVEQLADLLRPICAAARHRRAHAARDLRLHRLVGCAGRRGDARLRAGLPVPAVVVPARATGRRRGRASKRSGRSARNSSTRSRASPRSRRSARAHPRGACSPTRRADCRTRRCGCSRPA